MHVLYGADIKENKSCHITELAEVFEYATHLIVTLSWAEINCISQRDVYISARCFRELCKHTMHHCFHRWSHKQSM